MADIAATFHWPLPELDAMGLEELADWWMRAKARSGDGDGR